MSCPACPFALVFLFIPTVVVLSIVIGSIDIGTIATTAATTTTATISSVLVFSFSFIGVAAVSSSIGVLVQTAVDDFGVVRFFARQRTLFTDSAGGGGGGG